MPTDPPKPPFGLPYWIAHTPSTQNPRFHSLRRHADRVAKLARAFAEPLGFGEIAHFLGILHDLGKFSDAFQGYLYNCHIAARKGTKPPPKGSAPHKEAGALAARTLLPGGYGEIMAIPLFGHHGGMRSRDIATRKSADAFSAEEVEALMARAESVDSALRPAPPPVGPIESLAVDPYAVELATRMIYSCLTDADALDTEAHQDPAAAAARSATASPSIAVLLAEFQAKQTRDFAANGRKVNEVRSEVYAACVAAAEQPPGFFTLTVPTGGGKTRSSLAFALAHAARWRKRRERRVVYAIPFTSIVDQTADVFRRIFEGHPGAVLEHQSAIDPGRQSAEDEQWRRLSAQNWDAPIIVTTTVQLFESLFSNRPSASRKLHRLADSVIVLDEAQCLPTHLLAPIHSVLATLVKRFGVTVVFCTATQPAHDADLPHLIGIEARPIIPVHATRRHFEALRRVRYVVEPEPWDWDRLANQMRAGPSCLTVLNTRRQAIELMEALDPRGTDGRVLHLSTLLCGRHRRAVIAEVKRRLAAGESVLLVSTQVVEAGVDIDFPRVFRAVGPLDRIIQAAGRCNREGLRPAADSTVTIFTPESGGSPRGPYRTALVRTADLLACGEEPALDDPEFVTAYFRGLIELIGKDPLVIGKRVQDHRRFLRFEETAREAKVIDEETISVLVHGYAPTEADEILEAAKALGKMTPELWRRAQPLCVAVPAREAEKLGSSLAEAIGGLNVWYGPYDAKCGIAVGRGEEDLVEELVV
jgi:CRISPR-associated endonuclease/helicase Cas3